jgi:hypothetical protein
MTVITPLSSGVQPRARAQSAGGRPGLGVGRSGCRGATRRLTLHTYCGVARKRSPARPCMMISGPPLPTLALGRSAKPAHCIERLEQRAAHDVFDNDIPTTKRGNARVIGGGGTCKDPGAQRPRHRRRARSARPRPGCRRRPGARSTPMPSAALCPAQRARSALGAQSAERAARSAERETAIRLAARALARIARAIGAERAARGAALAEPAVPHCAL